MALLCERRSVDNYFAKRDDLHCEFYYLQYFCRAFPFHPDSSLDILRFICWVGLALRNTADVVTGGARVFTAPDNLEGLLKDDAAFSLSRWWPATTI